jgi:hypothetical protein
VKAGGFNECAPPALSGDHCLAQALSWHGSAAYAIHAHAPAVVARGEDTIQSGCVTCRAERHLSKSHMQYHELSLPMRKGAIYR